MPKENKKEYHIFVCDKHCEERPDWYGMNTYLCSLHTLEEAYELAERLSDNFSEFNPVQVVITKEDGSLELFDEYDGGVWSETTKED